MAITEFGLPVEREFAVTEAEAAQFMKQAVTWLDSGAGPANLTAIDYYNYRDVPSQPKWAGGAGMRDGVGTFRKTWFAFEELEGAARWPVPTTAFQANTGNLWTTGAAGGTADNSA